MLTRRRLRERGKLPFSKYFQSFKSGDGVALVKNLGVQSDFHNRMQGRTGKVVGKRGRAYVVEVKELNKEKTFIVKPIHLKKLEMKEVAAK